MVACPSVAAAGCTASLLGAGSCGATALGGGAATVGATTGSFTKAAPFLTESLTSLISRLNSAISVSDSTEMSSLISSNVTGSSPFKLFIHSKVYRRPIRFDVYHFLPQVNLPGQHRQ